MGPAIFFLSPQRIRDEDRSFLLFLRIGNFRGARAQLTLRLQVVSMRMYRPVCIYTCDAYYSRARVCVCVRACVCACVYMWVIFTGGRWERMDAGSFKRLVSLCLCGCVCVWMAYIMQIRSREKSFLAQLFALGAGYTRYKLDTPWNFNNLHPDIFLEMRWIDIYIIYTWKFFLWIYIKFRRRQFCLCARAKRV